MGKVSCSRAGWLHSAWLPAQALPAACSQAGSWPVQTLEARAMPDTCIPSACNDCSSGICTAQVFLTTQAALTAWVDHLSPADDLHEQLAKEAQSGNCAVPTPLVAAACELCICLARFVSLAKHSRTSLREQTSHATAASADLFVTTLLQSVAKTASHPHSAVPSRCVIAQMTHTQAHVSQGHGCNMSWQGKAQHQDHPYKASARTKASANKALQQSWASEPA